MGIFLRPAATVVATTALLLSTGAAAHAQTQTLKDKSSDVLSYTSMADERGVVLGYADSVASGVDLRSLRVKHTKKSVSVNVKLSQLANDTTIAVSLRLNGSSKPTRFLYNTYSSKAQLINGQGTLKCSVPLTTTIGKNGSINAVIKRSCLGNPKKIKASVVAMSPGAFEEGAPILADAVAPNSIRTEAWTTWLKAS